MNDRGIRGRRSGFLFSFLATAVPQVMIPHSFSHTVHMAGVISFLFLFDPPAHARSTVPESLPLQPVRWNHKVSSLER